MRKLTLFIGILLSVNSFSQDLHDKVSAVYNFSPSKMSSKEQQAVFPKLDTFFELVTKNKEKYLEPLRNELKRDDNKPYFYFDGGLLLLEISQTPMDIQLVADAFTKTDIKDLIPDVCLGHLLKLSLKGANVVDATLHLLDDPSFQAFIPQHALTLKYGEGLKFILPRYSSDLYINKLITKFNAIPSVDNKITCLDLFVYANCCEADKFLLSLKSDPNKKIQDKVGETIKLTSVSQNDDKTKYLENFNKRIEILNRISDEAVNELDDITLAMRKNYVCNQ